MTLAPPQRLVAAWLLSQPDQAKTGFADPVPGGSAYMIYRDGLQTKLFETGLRAVAISSIPGTLYPSAAVGTGVNVSCFADHTRDQNGLAVVEDGIDRCWASWGKLDQLLISVRPFLTGDPFIQLDRASPPIEAYDSFNQLSYVSCSYALAVLQSN